jgi:hypothetical protein
MALIARVGEVTHDDEVLRAGMRVPRYNENGEFTRWGWIEQIIRGQPGGGTRYSVRFINQDYFECDAKYILDLRKKHSEETDFGGGAVEPRPGGNADVDEGVGLTEEGNDTDESLGNDSDSDYDDNGNDNTEDTDFGGGVVEPRPDGNADVDEGAGLTEEGSGDSEEGNDNSEVTDFGGGGVEPRPDESSHNDSNYVNNGNANNSIGDDGMEIIGEDRVNDQTQSILDLMLQGETDLSALKELYGNLTTLFTLEHLETMKQDFRRRKQPISELLKAIPDADSFVLCTGWVGDVGLVNAVRWDFNPISTFLKAISARARIKVSRNFKPTSPSGHIPSRSCGVHEFPNLRLATLFTSGGVELFLTIHFIDEHGVLYTNCEEDIVVTLTEAHNMARWYYKDSITFKRWLEDPSHREDAIEYSSENLPQSYQLLNGRERGKRKVPKPISLPGQQGGLHLQILWDMLQKLSNGPPPTPTLRSFEWHGSASIQYRDRMKSTAKYILSHGYFMVQAAGFKKQWSAMSKHSNVGEVPEAPPSEMDVASWNAWLSRQVKKTHEQAEKIFLDSSHRTQCISTFYAFDIATKFHCPDPNIDVVLCGEVSERIVTLATKLKRNEITALDVGAEATDDEGGPTDVHNSNTGNDVVVMDDVEEYKEYEEYDEEEEEVEDDDDDYEEGEEDNAAMNDEEEDEEEEEDDEEVEEEDDVDDDEEEEGEEGEDDMGEDGDQLEALAGMFEQIDDLTEEMGDHLEEDDISDLKETILASIGNAKCRGGRTRYTQLGTTGVEVGNAQSKPGPGILLNARFDEDSQRIIIEKPLVSATSKCSPIVQFYIPNFRFSMQCQTRKETRSKARELPRMICEIGSCFEKFMASPKAKQEGGMFQLIVDLGEISYGFLEDIENHTLHVRHECTYITDPMQEGMEIHPPFTLLTSPLLPLRFVPKVSLCKAMRGLVDFHFRILYHFCSFKKLPLLLQRVPPSAWTAYCGFAESLVNLVGAGGGARGTLLKQSLDHDLAKEDQHYRNHFWTIHPDFLVNLDQAERIFCGLPFGVNEALLPMSLPILPVDTNGHTGNGEPGMHIGDHGVDGGSMQQGGVEGGPTQEYPGSEESFLDEHMSKPVPMTQTVRLPKIREREAYRNCMEGVYATFQLAGNDAATPQTRTVFDKISFERIGISDVETVELLFTRIAKFLIRLWKIEWAGLIADSLIKKQRKNEISGRIQLSNKRLRMRLHSIYKKSELTKFIDDKLEGGWPFGGNGQPYPDSRSLNGSGE